MEFLKEMNSEKTIMPNADRLRIVFSLLSGLKSRIQGFNDSPDVISAEISLMHIGDSLKKDVRLLRSQANFLLKEAIGQPLRPIEVDKHMDRIAELVGQLETPDSAVIKKWAGGEIGRELLKELDEVEGQVIRIQERIDGVAVSYGPADILSKAMSGILRILRTFFSPALLLVKILALLGTSSVIVLIYLWATMEREDALALNITTISAQISARQELLRHLGEEIFRIDKTILKMDENAKERGERLALVELRIKAHEARETRERVAAEILLLETSLADKEKKLSKLRGKTFSQRLLRLDTASSH
ncbi:MAG: hypothetical protein C4582_10110 [Desulfobacteraceae bacterium]|jgi:hypothetical protein|nr:MAG: hypothetical protein C4582_10110 [Desulfobacteraceae bacterium]